MPQKYDTFICDNDFTFDVSPRFISNDYGKNSKELDGTYRRHTVDEVGRIQREVRKQVQNTGIGTKSQQALKLQHEQLKTERKTVSRERREVEKQRRFEMKQQKKKEKHRGR